MGQRAPEQRDTDGLGPTSGVPIAAGAAFCACAHPPASAAASPIPINARPDVPIDPMRGILDRRLAILL